jgi:8-oxo-dGTP pyrophosphatase MutT (NUDIX family)
MSEVLSVVTCTFDEEEMVLLGERKNQKRDGHIVLPGGKATIGGHALNGSFIEHPLDTVLREVLEETGLLLPASRTYVAARFMLDVIVTYGDANFIDEEFMIDVFRTKLDKNFDAPMIREITETTELKPFWTPIHRIPYDQMPPDTSEWLPSVLAATDNELLTGFLEVDTEGYHAQIVKTTLR